MNCLILKVIAELIVVFFENESIKKLNKKNYENN